MSKWGLSVRLLELRVEGQVQGTVGLGETSDRPEVEGTRSPESALRRWEDGREKTVGLRRSCLINSLLTDLLMSQGILPDAPVCTVNQSIVLSSTEPVSSVSSGWSLQ